MERASLLLSLSPELIFQIVDHSPSTVLTLALTCSSLYRLCQPVLKQHRDAYKKYRVTSDLSPETVLHLFIVGPTAKIERWHVRELEIWGSRESWEDWRSWAPKLPGRYGLAKEAPSRSALSAQELQRYSPKGTEWWRFSEEEVSNVQRTLESGNDGYLKMLLSASCPRLHSIRFAKRLGDAWSSLMWITKAIVRSEHCGGIWPPGFHSLQNVAVDVSIGLSPDQDDDEIHGAGLATLLHLPHIKNLYYCKPSPNREDEEDEDFEFYKLYRLPTGTSSVESIFLDCPDNLPEEFYDALASAPKGLDTFAIRATCSYEHILNDVDSLVSALADKNPQLKRLIVYNGMGLGSEYEGVFSCPPSDFKCFEAIKHLSIGADDFENEGSCHAHGQDPDIVDDEWFHNIERSETLDFLLSQVIESGAYKDLKVIYVENVEGWACWSGRPTRKQLAFQKTTAAGRKAGVHICTLMNRGDGGYWKNFPAKPDRFDLKTGPCRGKRPADWRLNLDTGKWGPDCMGCGEFCFKNYSEINVFSFSTFITKTTLTPEQARMRIRKTRKKAIASKCLVDPSEHIVFAVTLRLAALLEPAAVFVQT
ncbi:unnamed protein product [Fusarium graminearum]|nr:unnamed protein product [Fusarium graminearum]